MKYNLVIEDTVDCDFGLYYLIASKPCENKGTLALINSEQTFDPEYLQGFHEAHLCDEHGVRVLRHVSRNQPEVNRPPWVQPSTTIPEGI